MKPVLKWAGGKSQLLPQIRELIPTEYNTYYEAFVGAGAVFLDLQPNKLVINDINPQLINLYRQIMSNYVEIVQTIEELDNKFCDKEYYLNVREKYNQKIAKSELDAECAALMIWINKHCFNGLYRVNSKGLFNVPYNNKISGKSLDNDNIKAFSEYLNKSQIIILNGDFEDAVKDAKAGDFVYFDSPYLPVSETANFTDYTKDGFSMEDHKRLAELFKKLDSIGVKVMLSNNDVSLVYELYDGFNIKQVCVNRAINSDASKRKGKEVIITNYEV